MAKRPARKNARQAAPSPRPGTGIAFLLLAILLVGIGRGLSRSPARSLSPPSVLPTGPLPLAGVTVLLDPGHGGTDPGAIRAGTREDALNYRFTATLAAGLRQAGATVHFTIRSDALNIPLAEGKPEPPLIVPKDACLTFNDAPARGTHACLWQRAAAGQSLWRDFPAEMKTSGRSLYFLSLHHDYSRNRTVHGGRVEYDRRTGDPCAFAQTLARLMAKNRLDGGPVLRETPRTDPRDLGVLNPLYNPIPQKALLEIATISNPDDRKTARTPAFRWKMARLILATIMECETGQAVASL